MLIVEINTKKYYMPLIYYVIFLRNKECKNHFKSSQQYVLNIRVNFSTICCDQKYPKKLIFRCRTFENSDPAPSESSRRFPQKSSLARRRSS